jgi:hypothetical protein
VPELEPELLPFQKSAVDVPIDIDDTLSFDFESLPEYNLSLLLLRDGLPLF